MDLYLYSKRLDLVATTLADLQALIAALADETDPVNAATIARVTARVGALVQSDSGEPLNIYSYDDAAGTVSSWVTDAGTTLAVGLGDPDPNTADTYASTSSFTVASPRVGTLALNTTALSAVLSGRISGRRVSSTFYLHIRKSTGGVTRTLALLPIEVAAGVLSATLSTGAITPSFAAGAVVPIPTITSLTGGGATALDGLATANGALAVGSTVLLSYGRIPQTWQLFAGTDAENTGATPAIVRPDDYNAATNAVVWVQLG